MKGDRITVIDMEVSAFPSIQDATNTVRAWLSIPRHQRKGRSICLANVHMCMEVKDCADYKEVVNGADMVLADGKPISIAQHMLGHKGAAQIRGTDMTLSLCELSHSDGITLGFYGGTSEVLELMTDALKARFPNVKIALMISPPFRPLTSEEDADYIRQINDSKVDVLFVGIGCPKQERWMAEHRDKLKCVMLGVGAAFDFIAGRKKHAHKYLQKVGLEWLFRLLCEPRRLWKRYLKHNPRFVYHFAKQLWFDRGSGGGRKPESGDEEKAEGGNLKPEWEARNSRRLPDTSGRKPESG